MTTTPRTDAAEIKVQCGFRETGTGQIPIAKCREIERDLRECQDAGKHYRANIGQLERELAAVMAERDRLLLALSDCIPMPCDNIGQSEANIGFRMGWESARSFVAAQIARYTKEE